MGSQACKEAGASGSQTVGHPGASGSLGRVENEVEAGHRDLAQGRREKEGRRARLGPRVKRESLDC